MHFNEIEAIHLGKSANRMRDSERYGLATIDNEICSRTLEIRGFAHVIEELVARNTELAARCRLPAIERELVIARDLHGLFRSRLKTVMRMLSEVMPSES